MTETTADIMAEVHELVFNNFVYKTDLEQYEMDECWVMPEPDYDGSELLVGDCEDFALACRKLCRDRGIDNTRLVYCRDELDGGHCVLEADGWIIDNRYRRVVTRNYLEKEGYKFIAVSGYSSGDAWRYIKN